MGREWQDCVTTFFDLDATKKNASSGHGSRIMRALHGAVAQAMDNKDHFRSVDRAYTWNDSVLFLAYVGNDARKYACALRDAAEFKPEIDAVGQCHGIRRSYAVAVKGQAFPPPENTGASSDGRFVFIEASSYAMANCLRIPHCFKENPHSWYIDKRIKDVVRQLGAPAHQQRVRLLPKRKKRTIYAYDSLWLDGVAP